MLGVVNAFFLEHFWLILMLLALALEAATVALLSIWFALGALVAWILEYLGASVLVQIIAFFGVSLVTLLLTFKYKPLRRKLCREVVPTNYDALIGQIGIVVQELNREEDQQAGQIRVNQQVWSAYISADETKLASYPVGTRVRVDSIAGVHAYVTAVK